jgi:hypothetical protein
LQLTSLLFTNFFVLLLKHYLSIIFILLLFFFLIKKNHLLNHLSFIYSFKRFIHLHQHYLIHQFLFNILINYATFPIKNFLFCMGLIFLKFLILKHFIPLFLSIIFINSIIPFNTISFNFHLIIPFFIHVIFYFISIHPYLFL